MSQLRGAFGFFGPFRAIPKIAKPTIVATKFRGFSTSETQVEEVHTVVKFQRASRTHQQPSGDNKFGYGMNRTMQSNDMSETTRLTRKTPRAPPPQKYRHGRFNVSEENRNGFVLLGRLKEGELLDDADRDVLLKFVKTAMGNRDFAQIFSISRTRTENNAVVAAVIHLLKGRIPELTRDTEFGPRSVQNMLSLNRDSRNARRVHNAIMSELFTCEQDFLNCALTQNGHLLIGEILSDGTRDESDLVLDTMKGNMMKLALDRWGRFVAVYALHSANNFHWNPLCDELIGVDAQIILLAKDKYGGYTIQSMLESHRIDDDQRALIAEVLKNNAVEIALSSGGPFTLETAIRQLNAEQRDALVAELIGNPVTVAKLACSEFGFNIIGYLMRHGTPSEQQLICDGMRGRMTELSGPNYNYMIQWAEDFLPPELSKPLFDELSPFNNGVTVADSKRPGHIGSDHMVLKSDSHEHKLWVANSFKESIHSVMEEGNIVAIGALKVALLQLPKASCDQITGALLNLPPSDIVRYAKHKSTSKILALVAKICLSTQLTLIAKAFEGHVLDLVTDKNGRQVMFKLVARYKSDHEERLALIEELDGAGSEKHFVKLMRKM